MTDERPTTCSGSHRSGAAIMPAPFETLCTRCGYLLARGARAVELPGIGFIHEGCADVAPAAATGTHPDGAGT